jgi:hypothetical protein
LGDQKRQSGKPVFGVMRRFPSELTMWPTGKDVGSPKNYTPEILNPSIQNQDRIRNRHCYERRHAPGPAAPIHFEHWCEAPGCSKCGGCG